jgi:hypothetical protein
VNPALCEMYGIPSSADEAASSSAAASSASQAQPQAKGKS